MKKRMTVILAVALLTLSVSAFAEGETQLPAQQQQTQTESADAQAQKKGRQNKQRTGNGQNGESDAVTGATQKPQDTSEKQTGEGQTKEKSQAGKKQGLKDMAGKESRQPGDGQSTGKERNYGGNHTPGKGRSGRKNGKTPTDQQADIAGLDLNTLVSTGVITRETADQIAIYLNTHQTAQSAVPELLKTLLDEKVITQAEYEAMLSALTVTAV